MMEKYIKIFNSKLYIIIPLIIIITFIISILLFMPRIYLLGESNVTISYKDTYKESGYRAKIFFYDISDRVIVDNKLEEKVGKYEIVYYIDYKYFKIKKIRNVTVVDDVLPIIEVDTDVIKKCPDKMVDIPIYKAIDEYDGDITDKVKVNVLENILELNVSDSSNNSVKKIIDIIDSDTEKPKIDLVGSNNIYLLLNDKYVEPGYKAYDDCDGDITARVIVSNNVNVNKVGKYQVTYSVMDKYGNEEKVYRTVNIYTNSYINSGIINNGEIYLTFDDGPNVNTTGKILDILKEENVSATFFVTANGPDYLIKRIYDEGHTIALHTASHDYGYIYSSVDNYLSDLNKVSTRVKNITGVESKIIRFPGGSSNTISKNYSIGIMGRLTSLVLQQGYKYYDWNVDSKDAGGANTSTQVYNNVINSLSQNRANMVLMHDTKNASKDALREIIRYGKNNGYTFKKITNETYMIRHSVLN